MIHPRFEQSGRASGRILIGSEPVAEIRELSLANLRFGPGRQTIIGEDVPLPLYWRQYAHHEDPERNAGSNTAVEQLDDKDGRLRIRCLGTDAGNAIRSTYVLGISFNSANGECVYEFEANLEVLPGKTWRVTYNPHHGELEFCNLWPEGTFSTTPGRRKAYTSCFAEQSSRVSLIPHHHLESSDKHNIVLRHGDRFGWLLEDENPVLEFLGTDEVTAGLCAYMWDAHFAYRCCTNPGEIWLQPGTRRTARFALANLDHRHGTKLLERSIAVAPPDVGVTPIYVPGLNTFRETIESYSEPWYDLWPWEFEISAGTAEETRGFVDREVGYDDMSSLCVTTVQPGRGLWLATTLGPAFGGPPFKNGNRYRLTAMVRSEVPAGMSRIGIRLHRENSPELGNTALYEHFWSAGSGSGTWTLLEATTPGISPPPDRVHLMLDHQGRGTSWFDNILFEEIP